MSRKPFCDHCKDARIVSQVVKAEWRNEEHRATPCPVCSVQLSLVPDVPLPRGPEPLSPKETARVMGVWHHEI